MKTMTIALVLAALACSKQKAKVANTTPKPTPTTPAKPDTPAAQVTQDQQVSPNLALAGDLLALCKITAKASTSPKFDYDKDELLAEDRAVLDQLADCLTNGALKGKAVSLIGRADPRGTDEYNLGLGSRRAHSVGQYLARLGVQDPQLAVTTRGSLDATGTDDATWQQDRRVDVQLAQD